MECLENEGHHLQLVGVIAVGADALEHLLHERDEVLGHVPDEASFLVDVVVVGPAHFLETSEADKLEANICILHAFANAVLALRPLILLPTVRLANVVEYVLQLRHDR